MTKHLQILEKEYRSTLVSELTSLCLGDIMVYSQRMTPAPAHSVAA